MRKRFFPALAQAVCIFLVLASGALALDCTGTVCGIPWGTKAASLEGFTKLNEAAVMDFYSAPLTLELAPGVTASQAVFGFGELGLYVVFFQPETTDGYNQAMDEIMAEYGNPVISNKGDIRVYRWTAGDVKIKAWRNMAAGERKLAFYNTSMEPPHRAGLYEKFADERSGFFPATKGDAPERTSILKF